MAAEKEMGGVAAVATPKSGDGGGDRSAIRLVRVWLSSLAAAFFFTVLAVTLSYQAYREHFEFIPPDGDPFDVKAGIIDKFLHPSHHPGHRSAPVRPYGSALTLAGTALAKDLKKGDVDGFFLDGSDLRLGSKNLNSPLVKKLFSTGAFELTAAMTDAGALYAYNDKSELVAFFPNYRLLKPAARETRLPLSKGKVSSLSFSSDGKEVAYVTNDGPIIVHVLSGKIVDWPGIKKIGEVQALTFEPVGELLAVSNRSGSVYFWNRAAGFSELPRTNFGVTLVETSRPNYSKLAFSLSGSLLGFLGGKNEILLKNSENWALYSSGISPEGRITTFAISPKRNQIAYSDDSRLIKVWSPKTGKIGNTLKGHKAPLKAIAFSPDGNLLASAGVDGQLLLWPLRRISAPRQLQGHKGSVNVIAFSRSGLLASAGDDETVRLWANSGELKGTINTGVSVNSMAISPKGDVIAVGGEDGRTTLWSLYADDPVDLAAIDIDSRLAAGNSLFRLTDKGPVELPQKLPGPMLAMQSYAVKGGGRTLWLAGRKGAIVKVEIALLTAYTAPAGNIASQATASAAVQASAGRANAPSTAPSGAQSAQAVAVGAPANVQGVPADAVGGPANAQAAPPTNVESAPQPSSVPAPESILSVRNLATIRSPANGQADLHAIRFKDAEAGVAAGDGTILRTANAGDDWTPAIIDAGLKIRDVYLQGDGAAWAVALPTPKVGAPFVMLSTADIAVGNWRVWWPRPAMWPILVGLPGSISSALLAIASFVLWWRRGRTVTRRVAGASDKPLDWNAVEARTLRPVARQISRFLRNVNTEPPLVLAITGRWGSGKSSLMNLLRYDLDRRRTRTVWFNAWHHRREDDLLAALLENVRLQAIPPFWTGSGALFRLRLFWRRSVGDAKSTAVFVFFALILAFLAVAVFGFDPVSALRNSLYDGDDTLGGFGEFLAKQEILLQLGGQGGVVWLGLFWIYRKIRALPLSPAKLVSRVSAKVSVADVSDKLGFRFRISTALREICWALRFGGSPGLVIFVDDLDRCLPEDTLSVLEAINFFMTAGPCIVVMGMDRRQVEYAVGEAFKDIVEGIPNEELQLAGEYDVKHGKRRAFARHYLEKMVNLDVAVPELSPKEAAALAGVRTGDTYGPETAEQHKLQKEEALERRWDSFRDLLDNAGAYARVALFVALFGFVTTHTWEQYGPAWALLQGIELPAKDKKPDTDAESKKTTGSTQGAAAADAAKQTPAPLGLKTIKPGPPVKPDRVAAHEESKISLSLFSGIGLSVLLMLAISLEVVRQVFLQRLNIERDPEEFSLLLREYTKTIHAADPTPRTIKRYLNKMRFLSSRSRPFVRDRDWIAGAAKWIRTNVSPEGQALPWLAPDFLFDKSREAPVLSDRSLLLLGTIDALDPSILHKDAPDTAKWVENWFNDGMPVANDDGKAAAWRMLHRTVSDTKTNDAFVLNDVESFQNLMFPLHRNGGANSNGDGQVPRAYQDPYGGGFGTVQRRPPA